MNVFIILLIGVFWAACAGKEGVQRKDSMEVLYEQKSCILPSHLLLELEKFGSRNVVNRLWKNDSLWSALMAGIASGDTSWFPVYDKIKDGTDGGSSEMLRFALGEALSKNPSMVLKRYGRAREYNTLCGSPDVDNAKYGSYERAEAEIKERISNVQSIREPSLQLSRDSCVAALEASIKPLRKYFGIGGSLP